MEPAVWTDRGESQVNLEQVQLVLNPPIVQHSRTLESADLSTNVQE